MNAQRLVRQLRREVKANPKRAALLAGLIAVGIYFWAPLVAGWVSPGETATEKSPVAKSAGQLAGGAATKDQKSKPSTVEFAAVPWTKLWAAIKEDRRNKPAKTLPATVDPFRPFPAPPEPADDAASQNVAEGQADAQAKTVVARNVAPADPTPRSLGMKLTGTIIGAKRRAAVIDGTVVAEGAPVSPGGASPTDAAGSAATTAATAKPAGGASSQSPRIVFRLTRVEARSATLQRSGKSYKLVIESPDVSGTEFVVLAPQAPN
ncbi:MAG: hypothetical protein WD875_00690 [Pirellulales bacterium]